ncbi:MAG: DUF262 domain-containing HNH endonuclease family protein [Campylobacteraceae bacterium]|jgi:uncharacterized protein with ParB-like and HNH nuclease domain|nr:DUF262 domain-containing HNH endonuclease family protein [Campylobacteraceae bacterium]
MKGIQGTSSKTYRQIMGNGIRYEVPKFQRDYTWEAEQWDDLWQDIQLLFQNKEEENEHYMGYLVLQTTNNKNFIIIDGQQRLTTLAILILSILKCLKDLIDRDVDVDRNRQRIDNLRNSYIGYIDPVTLISSTKLKLNRNSDRYYSQYLTLLGDLPTRNINISEKHMKDCFSWFYEKNSKAFDTGEKLAEFIDKLVDRLSFTVIEVTDQLNAFKVFETLNSRGVQLSSSDLLKNYLFSVVDETQPHSSEIEELESMWSGLVGKLGENKVEEYLRYFWNSRNAIVRKNELFKTIKRSIVDKKNVFSLVRDLRDTVDLYLAIQDPNDEFWQNRQDIKKALGKLKLFQIRQAYSLLIAGYKNLDIDSFSKLLKSIVIISFRYNIIGGLNPNEQENVYNDTTLKIVKNRQLDIRNFQNIYIDNQSFENDFSTKQFRDTSRNHKILKYIFSKIERYKYQNEIDFESDFYTIEHILPKSADENWGDFRRDEIDRSIFRIGNLTLLEKKFNQEADILSYSQKKFYYEKSSCGITKSIIEYYDVWNEDKISSRQKELAKCAKSIWTIQELES